MKIRVSVLRVSGLIGIQGFGFQSFRLPGPIGIPVAGKNYLLKELYIIIRTLKR